MLLKEFDQSNQSANNNISFPAEKSIQCNANLDDSQRSEAIRFWTRDLIAGIKLGMKPAKAIDFLLCGCHPNLPKYM